MFILTHIFYSFGFLFFLHYFISLIKFDKYYSLKEWYIKFQEVTGNRPKYKDFRYKSDYVMFSNKNSITIFEYMWVFLGVFTNSWVIFLFLIFLISISSFLIRYKKINFLDKVFTFNYLLIKVIIYLFLFINEFHLKLNINQIIYSIF